MLHALETLENRVMLEAGPVGLAEVSDEAGDAAVEVALSHRSEKWGIFGRDDRALVKKPHRFPWRTVGRLEIDWPNGTGSYCTGALVSAYHVLTAGHCVYSHDDGGNAESITIALARRGNRRPFGEARGAYVHQLNGWTRYEDFDYDLALITLDRRIGDYTGWLGYESRSGNGYYDGLTLNMAGYPGDLGGGKRLYSASGRIDFATSNRLFFAGSLDVASGQSGSPMWRFDSRTGDRYVHAVVSTSSPQRNAGVRINSSKFERIGRWIAEDDRLRAPTDRPDLTDHDRWFQTSASSAKLPRSGAVDRMVVSAKVRNNGTAAAGAFAVSFYLSENSTITEFDTLLGTRTVGSLGAFESKKVKWKGDLPEGLAPGRYYVGWIIDTGSSESEFEESNNTGRLSRTIVIPERPGDEVVRGQVLAMAADVRVMGVGVDMAGLLLSREPLPLSFADGALLS